MGLRLSPPIAFMAAILGLILSVQIAGCDQSGRSLVGAEIPPDEELAQERMQVELRDVADGHVDYWDLLRITIDPSGVVRTERGRIYFRPPRDLPPSTMERIDRVDTARLAPGRAAGVRRQLAVFRPERLEPDLARVVAGRMPDCTTEITHDPGTVMVSFAGTRGGMGLFVLQDSCNDADKGRVRAIIANVRRMLPPSAAAAGFNY